MGCTDWGGCAGSVDTLVIAREVGDPYWGRKIEAAVRIRVNPHLATLTATMLGGCVLDRPSLSHYLLCGW
jgi:hypothetical protein